MGTHKSTVVVTGRGAKDAAGGRSRHGHGYALNPFAGETRSDRSGFSGTCETALTDWIQLVQMGRREAVVSVCTHDGREGTLWCRDGDIIDAACDGLSGEDAVYRALSWQGGRLSIDFVGFDHRRKIRTPTAGLLLAAACRTDTLVPELVDLEGSLDLTRASRIGDMDPDTAMPQSSAAGPRRRRRRLIQVLASAAGALPFVLLSVLAMRWFSSAGHPSAQTPVAEFSVLIGADPPQAAIVLDGRQVGVGQLARSLPRDGRIHEIVCSAPGYVSERLVFRDAPPRQRVVLARREDSVPAPEPSPAELQRARRLPPTQSNQADGLLAHRRAVAARPRPPFVTLPDMAGPTAPESQPESAPPPAPAPAKVQIIDDLQATIQIIDDRKPRIDVIK